MKKKLKRWHVTGAVTGCKYLGVFEAATAEKAVEKALASDECCVSMCHQCSEECEDPEINEASASEAEDGA